MKTKQLLSTILFLFTVTFSFAQVSFTSAGVAVQGIARDDNNTAIQNQTITLEFEFTYKDDLDQTNTIGSIIKKSVVTDAFGVFSTIIDPGAVNNTKFANYETGLRIRKEGQTSWFFEQPLNHVPLAISANNGVPTGSIMPYVGKKEDVPAGWMLCDGSQIPTEADFLKKLLAPATAVPDLQGMFLRGAGTNDLTDVTTTLGEVQTHTSKSHSHNDNFAVTGAGIHQHTITTQRDEGGATGDNSGQFNWTGQPNNDGTQTSSTNTGEGNHTHGISGGVFGSGQTDNTTGVWGTETRPVNYGVNYIIKL